MRKIVSIIASGVLATALWAIAPTAAASDAHVSTTRCAGCIVGF